MAGRRLLCPVLVWSLLHLVTGQGRNINVQFELQEELKNGTLIGNIAAESNLETDGNSYNFLDDSQDTSMVNLNSSTGELTTASVIDREELCKFQVDCNIIFDVMVLLNGQLDQIINVNIVIEDVNDNTPDFKTNKFSIELLETKPVNSTFKIPSAEDLDRGAENSNVTYSLSTSADNFKLHIVPDPNNERLPEVYIMLAKTLDREEMSSYSVLVLAKDSGTPSRTGTLTVLITVLDENDNKPVFVESFLNISVTEDIEVGREIISVLATDKDDGNNGEVVYELKARQTEDIYSQFAVNNLTGALSVSKQLVFDPSDYQKQIFIIAKDLGSSPQSSQAEILLTIEDAGNNPPEVKLILIDNKVDGVKEMSEFAKIGDLVANVRVTDPDANLNGLVQCRTYNTYFGVERIEGRDDFFYVFIQHLLDRETKSKHDVTVSCIDGGELETSVNFTVLVVDENDSPPVFVYPSLTQFYYETTMKENNSVGAFVIKVSATDDDLGENGKISYRLNEEPFMSDELKVNETSGVVTARVAFDREKSAQKIFQILAVDNGNPPITSTTTVVVNLEDINDMRPQFTRANGYQFEIRESQSSGTYVNQVTAIDEDEGINQRVEFYLPDEYKANGINQVPFEVLEDGKILTNMELDREDIGSYTFTVGVHDLGTPQWDSFVMVVVKVTDINDNVPVFTYPSGLNRTVTALNTVSENPITQVLATDNDNGINQELMYFIENGDTENVFSMDANSGKLYIVKTLPLTADITYTLILRVEDKGQPGFEAREQLQVTLLYSNKTTAMATPEGPNSNVIIVATVVCITLLLSVTIIVVICVIRRKDMVKCGGSGIKFPMGKNKHRPNQDRVHNLANDKVYPEDGHKNKKEVSFSLEDGDSFSSNDFKGLSKKEKLVVPMTTRPTTLRVADDVVLDQSGRPITNKGILRPPQPMKTLDPSDVVMTVHHQREDSHSETSAETHHSAGSSDSRDSGNGGSEEEMHSPTSHIPKVELSQFNGSMYMIQPQKKPQPPLKKPSPINTLDLQRPSSNFNPNSQGMKHNGVQKWNSDYPDSGYLSSYNTSPHNSTQNHLGYSDPKVWLNTAHPNSGYTNQGYTNSPRVPYHSQNSYLDDDDDSTTTSGSYVINENESLDDSQFPHTMDSFGCARTHNV